MGLFTMKAVLRSAAAALALALAMPAQAATLVARVDVASQKMTVMHHGDVLYEWKVSTGAEGFATPRGEFRPYRMHKMWLSRSYNSAPMPYAVFYDRGWAVHGTDAVAKLGLPASHGCVRLDTPNAEIFYNLVRQYGAGNTRIIVEN